MKKNYPTYVSKHDSKCEKKIILLTIPNGEGWCYRAVKKITSIIKKSNISYCLNCLHSVRIKSKLESHKKCVNTKIFVTL